LLGIPVRTVQSYEQGRRVVPAHIQLKLAHILFLKQLSRGAKYKPCWTLAHGRKEYMSECPAYKLKAGTICWLVTGTRCRGLKAVSKPLKTGER
jgi:hypothetical protein